MLYEGNEEEYEDYYDYQALAESYQAGTEPQRAAKHSPGSTITTTVVVFILLTTFYCVAVPVCR